MRSGMLGSLEVVAAVDDSGTVSVVDVGTPTRILLQFKCART